MDLDERDQKLFETSKFLGKLLLAGLIFQTLLFIYPDTSNLQSLLAGIITEILRITGMESFHRSTTIMIENSAYIITQDCLGWKSMALFSGLIFAASDRFRDEIKTLGTGILILFAANIIRILTTIYLSHFKIISYEIIHGILWKWGLAAVVLIVWIFWLRNREALNRSAEKL